MTDSCLVLGSVPRPGKGGGGREGKKKKGLEAKDLWEVGRLILSTGLEGIWQAREGVRGSLETGLGAQSTSPTLKPDPSLLIAPQ